MTSLFVKRNIRILLLLVLFVLILFSVIPGVWIFITAFKNIGEIYAYPPTLIPKQPTLENFLYILQRGSFPLYFRNSALVSLGTTFLSLVVTVPAGYAFSRFHFWGSGKLLAVFLVVQMFPGVLLIIPLFQVFKALDLINSLSALVLANVTFALPMSIWLVKTAFDQVPVEIEEAAQIDGCGWLSALLRVTLPVSIPGLVAAAIFTFIAAWDEFIFALTFISSDELRTLPVGLQYFISAYEINWNHLAAGSVVATLPVLILFYFVLRGLTLGVSSWAMKG